MRKIVSFSKKDTTKKKITIISIWLFAITFPFLFSIIIHTFLSKITGLYYYSYFCNSYLEYILFPLFSLMSLGLIFGSKFMRKATLFILYLSMILMITNHVIKSMEIYSIGDGCFSKFIGYGIDYNSLIHPEVILMWTGTIVFIILFHMPLVYLFNNKESSQFYSLPKKIQIKENLLLLFSAGILTIVFIFFPITTLLCISKKDMNITTISQPKITLPKSQTKPLWLNYEHNEHNLTYEIKFECNSTTK